MSKKISTKLGVGLCVLSLVIVLLIGLRVTGQQSAAKVSPAASKAAAISALTDEVLKETGEIRQLSVLNPVKSGAMSRAEIERMIVKNLDDEATPAEMRANELTLKKFGLVPSDFQYRQFIVNLLTEQVAGYYDPKVKQYYLADWIAIDGQTPVMAHELTHALQDQHFNLRRFEKWPKDDGDAELAAHALVEGDATVVMMRYIMRKPQRMTEFMTSMGGSAASSNEKIDSAPRALRETLLFPYEEGSQFATWLYARGGWKSVSQAFTDLPQSSEQILHVEKYLSREAPVKIDIPDVARLLGKSWRRLDYDVNGEWGYYLILDEYLKSSDQSTKAAAGWGGDRYALYEGPRGELVLIQITEWDSEQDANQFYNAYVTRSERRYNPTSSKESLATLATPMRQTVMETSDGRVMISQNGSRVTVIEGLKDGMDTSALVNALAHRGPTTRSRRF